VEIAVIDFAFAATPIRSVLVVEDDRPTHELFVTNDPSESFSMLLPTLDGFQILAELNRFAPELLTSPPPCRGKKWGLAERCGSRSFNRQPPGTTGDAAKPQHSPEDGSGAFAVIAKRVRSGSMPPPENYCSIRKRA